MGVFLVFVALIGYRVVGMQVIRADALGERAVAERFSETMVPARRGDILDANGLPLATNAPSARIWGVLSQVEDRRTVAETLAPLLNLPVSVLQERLDTEGADWVLLASQIPSEAVPAIQQLALPGIILEPEPSRVYPNGTFLAHVLGFTNDEQVGNYGVEGAYDQVIGGTPGLLEGERDGEGNVIALSPSRWQPPVDGAALVLTIDSGVQQIIERVLLETIETNGAEGGTIIVQDPKTGAILGMASWPVYDPNAFTEVDDIGVFTNPAVSTLYEPGSTFKAIVMAIGIDDGVVSADTVHDDSPGYIEVPGHAPITNNNGRVWGEETMTQVLERSTNLGAIFVAQQIGTERFYRRLADFGIGKPTGIDLQGEEQGILTKPWERDWNETLFYTNAFGQGVAVTPIQLINAVSAIVNGGYLMEPYVVAEERWPDGSVVSHQPQVVRQVISEASSATLREMLQSVVDNGTGVFAAVEGYEIGAKTGTSQVPSPDGGYLEEATTASIVGFGPVDEPRFTVLVKIDKPKESPWGETVAGPALQQVLTELFQLYGIPPAEGE